MNSISSWLLVLILVVVGLSLTVGGVVLVAEGGSYYYLGAGAALLASAMALLRQQAAAVVIYGCLLLVTLLWSLWEVGLNGWALAPRLLFLAVIGLLFLLPSIKRLHSASQLWIGIPFLACITGIGLSALLAVGSSATSYSVSLGQLSNTEVAAAQATQWKHWGKNLGGQRYVATDQVNTANVGKLELAWRYDSGLKPPTYLSFEATPLFADGRLYVCLKPGIVAALDPDTGEQLWRYSSPKAEQVNFSKIFGGKCRGVSYYEAPEQGVEARDKGELGENRLQVEGRTQDCPRRIITISPDGYLLAINATDGHLCESFGQGGLVDLHEGIALPAGTTADQARHEILAMPSSPAAIVNGVAVIGQTVTDLGSLDSPSGVIRGYDAITGELKWAWDAGRPDQAQLEAGEFYTRNTPNAWGVFSGDEELGLVYVPTGNSLPDYYGGSRPEIAGPYSSAIVAIDVHTGKVRWTFQTVHHDTWDYDIGSQPVVMDLPDSEGGGGDADSKFPALLVPNKLGQIFVLDRRTGEAFDRVIEKPVPQQGAVPGERLSKTQPYTTGFPSLSGPDLTEADMWGISPIDQMMCRIMFKRAHYLGQFTPISDKNTIMYPGTAGGINWGSVSIDPQRDLLFVNTLRFANFGRLIPRADAPADGYGGKEGDAIFKQNGTPYAFVQSTFMSPLKVPCQQPPYGTVNVLDLKTRELVWSKSFGTAATSGPLGIPSLLPFRLGAPNMGGSVVTAGGLAFIGASLDRKLRAFDISNGRELWNANLPAVAAASPMSYISPNTGKQYVVIAAGGHYGLPGPAASAVMAFALSEN